MANTYLQRTLGTPTSAYKGTLSWWQKGASTNTTYYVLACESGSERFLWYVSSGAFGGGLRGTSSPPDIDFSLSGTPKFRDVSGWYNFVLAWDSTQSTASDRIKFYVNNVQYAVSSSGTSGVNDIPLNHVMPMNKSGLPFRLGSNITGGNYFTGLMSHIHLIDGIAYDATAFGETDANGVWKIKTSPSVTYGNNGAFILKDGNSVTDQSGNSNNFTVGGGTLTKTEDNPSNVFCTFNKLYNTNANNDLVPAITLGNTMLSGHGSGWFQIPGTLAFNKGKFYWECKFNAGTNLDKNTPGVIDYEKCFGTGQFQDQTGSVFYKNEDGGETRLDGNTSSADYGTLAQNDILGIAVDMDAATPTVKYYKNGSLLVTVNASSLLGKFITPANTVYASGEYQVNFGNGYFGTTAVSSAGTNASGNGIFEFDVPTNYTALSTKGLNL